MYHKRVLLCFAVAVATVYIATVSASENCTLFECSSTLNQNACSAKGEYLEVDTTVTCCPKCRRDLSKLRPKMCYEYGNLKLFYISSALRQ